MTKVTVFSTPTCPWCLKAKAFLDENKVEYENKDVSTDEEARNALIEKSGQMGVPVIMIDETVIVGFDEEKIKEKLSLK